MSADILAIRAAMRPADDVAGLIRAQFDEVQASIARQGYCDLKAPSGRVYRIRHKRKP